MTQHFVDTSALAKRYVVEAGSEWMRQLTRSNKNSVIISDLTVVELFSAFSRLVREGRLTTLRVSRIQSITLLHTAQHYTVISLDGALLTLARDLVTQYPLRTLDAIQLAAAKAALQVLNEPITFVTSDRNLKSIAATEGFATDDPNDHATET